MPKRANGYGEAYEFVQQRYDAIPAASIVTVRSAARHYLLIVGLAILVIAATLRVGSDLPGPEVSLPFLKTDQSASVSQSANAVAASPAKEANAGALSADPLTRLLLQLSIIIAASYVIGWLFGRCGQPAVVGEMMAGVLLGPSLFGWIAPDAFRFVFAANSLEPLRLLSQIGVCLFMFAVGMELDLSQIRHRAERLLVISHGSIAIPYLFGMALALPLYRYYANPGASFAGFALFMGISMSITAFPVLVRILKDKGLFGTPLGRTATLCAALGDVTAWCILAFVIAVAGAASLRGAVVRMQLVALYGATMLLVVRPILARLLARWLREEHDPDKTALVLVSTVVLLSSLSTEQIGIHALFGAFLAGIIMPAGGGFRRKLTVRIEHFSSVLLLPVFFAFVGLRTQVGLLGSTRDWLACGLIIVVATLGKIGGTALIARASKYSWHDALGLGALMNSRGLMELIALNIGYEMGILSMRIFTMLVLMAIVTTVMTGPLIGFLTNYKARAAVGN